MIKHSYSKNLTVIICLLALLSVSPTLFAQDAKPFVDTWNGSLSAMGQEFEIIVEFSIDEDGTKIEGKFSQGPAEGTFTLEKAARM